MSGLMTDPLLVLAVCLCISVAVAMGLRGEAQTLTRRSGHALRGAGWLVFGLLACAMAAYVVSRGWIDHLEPTVACVSCLFSRGLPVYPAPDSPERYALLYGPNAFIAEGLSMHLLGTSTFAAKLPGAIFALAAVMLVWAIVRKGSGRKYMTPGLAWFCAACLFFLNVAFWDRADSQLLFWTALGLWACLLKSRWRAGAVLGVALGAAVNLKVHSPIYFLPVLGLLIQRHRWAAVLPAFAAAGAMAAWPFMAFDNISLAGWWRWARLAPGHGFELDRMALVVKWAMFCLAPVAAGLLWWWRAAPSEVRESLRRNKLFVLACVAAAALIVVPAAKKGAGPHHLVGFFPVVAVVLAHVCSRAAACPGPLPDRLPLVAAWAAGAAAAIVAVFQGACVLRLVYSTDQTASNAVQEIRQVLRENRDLTVAMGYGDNSGYPLTFYRTELVRAAQPYLLDAAAMMDMRAAHLPTPPATLQALRDGQVQVWLIPRGQRPFSMRTYYKSDGARGPLFDEELRSTFEANYLLVKSGRMFDIWQYCPPEPQ